MSHTIPVVMFLRPNGRRQPGSIQVPAEYETPEKIAQLEEVLVLLGKYGIDVTTEDVPGDAASVCLDTGEFDYKTGLFALGEGLARQITEFVLSFDEQDYLKVMAAYEDGEDMFGEDESAAEEAEDTHDGHPIAKEGEDGG